MATSETMTIGELIEWGDNLGTRESLDGVLVRHGFLESVFGNYTLSINDHTEVVIHWPKHCRSHRPDGDIACVSITSPTDD